MPAKQHGEDAKKEIVAQDDISRKLFQDPLQALVLGMDCIDVYMLQGEAQPPGPGRYSPPFGERTSRSLKSTSARPGNARNGAPSLAKRARMILADKPRTLQPSFIKVWPMASSGLRWPVRGVAAIRTLTLFPLQRLLRA